MWASRNRSSNVVGAGGDVVLLAPPAATERALPHALAALAGGAEAHVLDDREAGQALRQLERAHHPAAGDLVRPHPGEVLAVERPAAAVGLVEAGEQVEQRRLAGAVGSDQRRDLAPLDLDVIDVDRHQPAEPAPHAVGDEDRVGLGDAGDGLDRGQVAASVSAPA